jgi:hypothetical protein
MLPAMRRATTAATPSLWLAPAGIPAPKPSRPVPIRWPISRCAEFVRDAQSDARWMAGSAVPGVAQAGLRAWMALPLMGVERVIRGHRAAWCWYAGDDTQRLLPTPSVPYS